MHTEIRKFLSKGGWFTVSLKGEEYEAVAKRPTKEFMEPWTGMSTSPDMLTAMFYAVADYNGKAFNYISARKLMYGESISPSVFGIDTK